MGNQIVININRLGPVRNARITLGQFMIFSGASSLGKSYTAMLVHYVYRVLSGEELIEYFKQKQLSAGDVSRFDDIAVHEIFSVETADLLEWVHQQAKVYLSKMLSYGDLDMDVSFEFPKLPKELHFYYHHIETVEQNMPNITPRGSIQINNSGNSTSFSRSMLSQVGETIYAQVLSIYSSRVFKTTFMGATFFLPPSRGAIMQVPFGSQAKLFGSAPMYFEFLETFANIRTFKEKLPSTIDTSMVLEGQFEEKDGELIYNYHDVPIPISATASSIKEIAPFVMLAKVGLAKYFSTLFEEPESHLHPEMQSAVVDVMAQMLQRGMHLQITTHSDYVLRRINDLIYLDKIRDAWTEGSKYYAFCEKYGLDGSITIDPEEVKAYFFKAEENGLSFVIEQNLLDGVPFDTFEKVIDTDFPISADIYEQFEKLEKKS